MTTLTELTAARSAYHAACGDFDYASAAYQLALTKGCTAEIAKALTVRLTASLTWVEATETYEAAFMDAEVM